MKLAGRLVVRTFFEAAAPSTDWSKSAMGTSGQTSGLRAVLQKSRRPWRPAAQCAATPPSFMSFRAVKDFVASRPCWTQLSEGSRSAESMWQDDVSEQTSWCLRVTRHCITNAGACERADCFAEPKDEKWTKIDFRQGRGSVPGCSMWNNVASC